MGILKTLLNELIGTNKEYEVKGLGIFTCKVCSWWQDEHYTWGGKVRLPFYSEDTFIMLEGDASGPSSQQLSELWKLFQNWESIISDLESKLLLESKLAHKEEIYASWQETFYPDSINPDVQYNDGWEIAFERKDDLKDYFYFIWRNNTIQDLTLDVGA